MNLASSLSPKFLVRFTGTKQGFIQDFFLGGGRGVESGWNQGGIGWNWVESGGIAAVQCETQINIVYPSFTVSDLLHVI